MKIALFGGSGFVGKALLHFLKEGGWDVVAFQRKDPAAPYYWNPEKGILDQKELEPFSSFINLAGEPIFSYWSAKKKRAIRESRVISARLIAEKVAALSNPSDRTVLQTSAIGFYGDRGEETLDEASSLGKGFLAEVCHDWEAALKPLELAGVRTLILRFGMVLDPNGGALKQMVTPFKLGLGGRIGSGLQWVSWIALDDLVRSILFLALKKEASGIYNLTAPNPVRNIEFTKDLAEALHRYALIPIPAFVLKTMAPGLAEELLLASSAVYPKRLEAAGFQFLFPQLAPYFHTQFD